MIGPPQKPTTWEEGEGWFRIAAVWPNVLCHAYQDHQGFTWEATMSFPGVCVDDDRGEAESLEDARAKADAAALRMIEGVAERMREALAALSSAGRST